MTYLNYLIWFTIAFLGMVIHIFGVKLPAFKTRSKAANVQFNYGIYFQDELSAIICSVAIILLGLILAPAALHKWTVDPLVVDAIFCFLGFTDSSIIIAKMGKADTKLNAIIDEKTNIADDLPPPATK